jgi:hypothetical protein
MFMKFHSNHRYLPGVDKENCNNGSLIVPKAEKKEDRIGESQPFRERILSVKDKVRPRHESNPPPSA